LIHPYSSFSDQSVSEKNSFLKYTHLFVNTLVTTGSYYSKDNTFNKKTYWQTNWNKRKGKYTVTKEIDREGKIERGTERSRESMKEKP